ncbi:hypothetical protein LENED_010351 [Lentinula edodes]|uniref:Uncharacterized protein n=1 Tax=Lentinula edodes TaxID=5353 RepID=A0A1Q3EM87_LENED|nr:hypothetical protein LENED_010351 [Lentinula edodes]
MTDCYFRHPNLGKHPPHQRPCQCIVVNNQNVQWMTKERVGRGWWWECSIRQRRRWKCSWTWKRNIHYPFQVVFDV